MDRKRFEHERPKAGAHFPALVDGKAKDALKRYGVALGLAGVALLLRGVLTFPEGTAIYQLPLVAVLLSAWYGGRGPGLLASAICVTGVSYWFVPPVGSFETSPEHVLPLSIFAALCLLVTLFAAGRRRVEWALRASEERFRTLVQYSFDVYWESDAQHRFTRQEFAAHLSDAPARASEIGRARWEIPYLEPDENAWREHRAILDAHLPFRDFELARPTPDGGKRYVSVSGMPVFDETGRFVGYRGVGRHISERKRAEAEHRAHVWFLESLDRINRAVQGTNDLERMMSDVLDAVLEIFGSDRAWLAYPCDPDAPSWRVVMEHTRPQFPGAFVLGRELPMTAESAEVARAALGSRAALPGGPGHERQVKAGIAERFGVRSEMLMALHPKGERPYLFGLHQCSQARSWTREEQRLFEAIGHRLADALGSLLAFRALRESERRLEAAQRLAHVGWWERDYESSRVSLSEEACRIFGVQPIEMPQWQGRWLGLIHPEDRPRVAAASEASLAGGARYDVEYRVVRADGTVRVVHSQGDVTRDAAGRPVRQFGVMQDITELRQTERKLEAAQRLARVGWWERDYVAGRMTYSEEVGKIYGIADRGGSIDLQEWLKVMPSLIHPDDRARAMAVSEAAYRGGTRYEVEYRVVHRDGTVRVVHSQGDVTLDPAGRPVRNFGVAQDVTELRRAEDTLRQSQAYLAEAQRLSHAGSWALDVRSGEFTYFSDEFLRIFGFDPRRGLPTKEDLFARVLPDDRQALEALQERTLHEKVDTAGDFRIALPDGTIKHIHAIRHPVVNDAGDVVQLVGTSIDITERKRAEDELRASTARLEEAQRIAHLGYWDRDLAANRVVLAEESWRIFGIPPEERTTDLAQWSERWLALMHPEDRTRVLAAVQAALEGGPRYDVEFRITRRDGETRVVHSQGDVIRDASGRPYRMFGTQQDVTELRNAERELRARQDMLDLAQKAAHAVAYDWYFGAREQENRWSPEIHAMFGIEAGTFDGTLEGWKKMVHPEDWPAVRAAIKRAQQTGDVETEYRVVHKDGSVHWLHGKGRMFFDAEGRPERNVGFLFDVTDRRQAEEEVRAAEARFRTFVDHAIDAFFLHDETLKLVDVNRQACRSLGYSREELIGMHPRIFDAGLSEDTIAQLAERARAGESMTFETRHRRKDGTVFPVEIRTGTFREGDRLFYLSLGRDISERKDAEEKLRSKDDALQVARAELARVSRVTMLGELTASIAHEVNQPLGAMVANAAACTRWLAADPPETTKTRRALESIAADGRRASEVIGRIRALVKRQAPRTDRVDVNRKVRQVIEFAGDEIRRNGIVLRTELAEGLPGVEGDRVQLQQVLLNLVLNSIDAMSAMHERSRRELTIASRRDGADAVLVEVRDTGPGIAREHGERLFEPFFTTKAEGLGIGLSISRSIIEAHGGRLWMEANRPHGAIFRFSLPAAAAAG